MSHAKAQSRETRSRGSIWGDRQSPTSFVGDCWDLGSVLPRPSYRSSRTFPAAERTPGVEAPCWLVFVFAENCQLEAATPGVRGAFAVGFTLHRSAVQACPPGAALQSIPFHASPLTLHSSLLAATRRESSSPGAIPPRAWATGSRDWLRDADHSRGHPWCRCAARWARPPS